MLKGKIWGKVGKIWGKVGNFAIVPDGHYPLLMGSAASRKKDDANLSRKKLLYSYGPKVKVREVGNNILFFI